MIPAILRFRDSAKKEFRKIPKNIQSKIYSEIQKLKTDPLKGAKLKGKLSPLRRIKIGKYRVAYQFKEEIIVIVVVKIGHRKDFYNNLERLF